MIESTDRIPPGLLSISSNLPEFQFHGFCKIWHCPQNWAVPVKSTKSAGVGEGERLTEKKMMLTSERERAILRVMRQSAGVRKWWGEGAASSKACQQDDCCPCPSPLIGCEGYLSCGPTSLYQLAVRGWATWQAAFTVSQWQGAGSP